MLSGLVDGEHELRVEAGAAGRRVRTIRRAGAQDVVLVLPPPPADATFTDEPAPPDGHTVHLRLRHEAGRLVVGERIYLYSRRLAVCRALAE